MNSSLNRSLTNKKLNVTLNTATSSKSLGSKKQYLSLVTPEVTSERRKKTFADLKKQVTGKEGSNLRSVHELVKTRKVLNKEEG